MRSIIKLSIIVMLITTLVINIPGALLAQPKTIKYEIAQGDTVWGISQKFKVNMGLLAAINNMDQDDPIFVGHELIIPVENLSGHRVKPGDTLWDIAKIHDVTVDQLLQENGLENGNFLRVGQVLSIPEAEFKAVWLAENVKKFLQQAVWPLRGVISSRFGLREGKIHEGIDIAAETGNSVKASLGGKVIFAAPRGTYGNTVIIKHDNGVRTLYAHNSKLLVKEGDLVPTGKPVAKVGNTGRSTGPHLHFEILVHGTPIDPLSFLSGDN